LDEPYAAVSSERIDRVLQQAFAARQHLGSRLWLSRRAVHVTSTRVELETGEMLEAELVIAGRGPQALDVGRAGYQKFVGLDLELRAPAPFAHPVLMDALLPQRDGFRFMYALPLDERRVLLEDTYFSDDPELDPEHLEREISLYAVQAGVRVSRVLRRESGVLPLPLRLPPLRQPSETAPLVAGYEGGWFHPVTGYSFPLAARIALAVASVTPAVLREQVWPALARQHRAQQRFFVLLNRMLFGAFAPHTRVHAIERFYQLPPESVRRFYAARTTPGDRLRIVCGRPPRGFSMARAIGLASNRSAEVA
jgi:lycopene beta-cyclase